MPRFKVLEHTADAGIEAEGRDLAQAFANVAYGMFSLIADLKGVANAESREVEVEAPDREALLVRWLNELLYIFDTEHLLLRRFRIREMSSGHLVATVSGEKANPSRHRLKTAIKAATYHDLLVEEGDGARVQVILDL
ncbi:MAG: archease [Chloroflexi bacterium]|nr:archease [Chloroflexota bacterium]